MLSAPHVAVVTLYFIVALPVSTPPTTPLPVTVAIAGFKEVHVPAVVPVVASEVVPATQTLSNPVSVPASGSAFTTTVVVVVVLPQPEVVAV